MATIEEHLVKHLKDAHALEQMSLQMTKSAAEATDDPQLHQLFDHHHKETEQHERLIRERIEAHGESPSKIKDMGAQVAAMGKGMAAMGPSDAAGRLARDGYVQEQTEIAAYELLSRVAERAGDPMTVEVSRQILEDERRTAEKIAGTWDHATELSLIEAGISA